MEFLYDCDYVINIAAESHVGNSIIDSNAFINTNILGTKNLLELVRAKPDNSLLRTTGRACPVRLSHIRIQHSRGNEEDNKRLHKRFQPMFRSVPFGPNGTEPRFESSAREKSVRRNLPQK